jgi:hypothetical protein
MPNNSQEERNRCQDRCEDLFVQCTDRTPRGCVESLRLCREGCSFASGHSES